MHRCTKLDRVDRLHVLVSGKHLGEPHGAVVPVRIPQMAAEFSHLDVINAALTASGYIIHRSFATTLLHNFLQAAYHLNESNCSKAEYAHDVLWTKRQQSGKWFALKPVIGRQRASYSDIEKMNVDYKVKLRL